MADAKQCPVELNKLAGYEQVPAAMGDMMQHTSDGLLVFGKCVGDLARGVDRKLAAHMTPEEKKEFNQLEADKEGVVDAVDNFVRTEGGRYRQMLQEACRGVSVSHLIRNTDSQGQITTIDALVKSLRELKTRYKTFHDKLIRAMELDGRKDKEWYRSIAGWTAAFTTVGVAIGAIIVVVLHFIPGVNVVLGVGELAAVILGGSAIVAGGVTTAIMCFRKDEMQRALEYLENIEANLQHMKVGMQNIRQCPATLDDDRSVAGTKELIKAVIARCDKVVKLCEEVGTNGL